MFEAAFALCAFVAAFCMAFLSDFGAPIFGVLSVLVTFLRYFIDVLPF